MGLSLLMDKAEEHSCPPSEAGVQAGYGSCGAGVQAGSKDGSLVPLWMPHFILWEEFLPADLFPNWLFTEEQIQASG